MLKNILQTGDEKTTLIIRLMVGAVFVSEGIQKFLFADKLGVGRFTKIGLPNPEFLGPFVGTVETICGALVLVGLLTRIAAVPLITIMITAIITTKVPMIKDNGIWFMLHESRTDWAMLLGSIFLMITGGGRWSMDRKINNSR